MRSVIVIPVLAVCMAAAVTAVPQVNPVSPALAQQQPPEPDASSEEPQVKLTDADMKKFIAVQTELLNMAEDVEDSNETPDPKLGDKLEALARKHGFESFEQFDDVASTVALVMEGLDPDTKEYTDPKTSIAADIADVKKDTTLTDQERKEVVADLEEAMRTTPSLQHPENIETVRRFAEQIEKLLQ